VEINSALRTYNEEISISIPKDESLTPTSSIKDVMHDVSKNMRDALLLAGELCKWHNYIQKNIRKLTAQEYEPIEVLLDVCMIRQSDI